MLLLLHVVCPTDGNNRHNRDILDSNNCSAFYLISPNTTGSFMAFCYVSVLLTWLASHAYRVAAMMSSLISNEPSQI